MKYQHTSGNQRPWSKLQKQIYNLIDPNINLQIHCVAYPIGKNNAARWWITLDKEIIWDFPKDFLSELEPVFPVPAPFTDPSEWSKSRLTVGDCYPYSVPHISGLIRTYIDTPKDILLERKFKIKDDYGLANILKAADRRIGREKLKIFRDRKNSEAVQKIIDKRLAIIRDEALRRRCGRNAAVAVGGILNDGEET